ncbi:hypothetical protein X890_5357 [Burkholderia pseudomallei MSHR4299]|nr:hypothetical protein X890_5357 [Burkholderia pseudomallei MSHR4299]
MYGVTPWRWLRRFTRSLNAAPSFTSTLAPACDCFGGRGRSVGSSSSVGAPNRFVCPERAFAFSNWPARPATCVAMRRSPRIATAAAPADRPCSAMNDPVQRAPALAGTPRPNQPSDAMWVHHQPARRGLHPPIAAAALAPAQVSAQVEWRRCVGLAQVLCPLFAVPLLRRSARRAGRGSSPVRSACGWINLNRFTLLPNEARPQVLRGRITIRFSARCSHLSIQRPIKPHPAPLMWYASLTPSSCVRNHSRCCASDRRDSSVAWRQRYRRQDPPCSPASEPLGQCRTAPARRTPCPAPTPTTDSALPQRGDTQLHRQQRVAAEFERSCRWRLTRSTCSSSRQIAASASSFAPLRRLRIRRGRMRRPPARAMRAGPACRSASAATRPAARTPTAPCSSASTARLALSMPRHRRHPCSTRRGVSRCRARARCLWRCVARCFRVR